MEGRVSGGMAMGLGVGDADADADEWRERGMGRSGDVLRLPLQWVKWGFVMIEGERRGGRDEVEVSSGAL